MWRDIRLIGRDRLLIEHIRPRLKERTGFVLVGQHGIGKSALLEWAAENSPGKAAATVSATWTVKEIFKGICQDWDLTVKNDEGEIIPKSRWQVASMEQTIYTTQPGKWLMVDDIHQATPAVLRRLKIFRERFLIVGAGVPPFRREELRRIMWGLPEVHVKPLPNSDMRRIARAAAPILGTRTPLNDAIHASRGIPGQLLHVLRGEVTAETVKTEGEEIDLSPILLLVLVGIMMTRYIAVGIESTSLYILGGFGMALGLVFRFFLFKGMSK